MTIANDTESGLAYLCSRDIGRIVRVAEQFECGTVGREIRIDSTAEANFGGIKQSGLGLEGLKYGLNDFLEIKYVCLAVPSRVIIYPFAAGHCSEPGTIASSNWARSKPPAALRNRP